MTPEDKSIYDKEYRKINKERIAAYHKKYRQDVKESSKNRYRQQKSNAQRRGIVWQFTYLSWLEWWAGDFKDRGLNKGQLMMCRYGDSGPYHPGNCYKGSPSDNVQDAWDKRRGVMEKKEGAGTQEHYTTCGIEPIEIIMKNKLDYLEGNVLKYLLRYKRKNGVEDLKKADQYLAWLIEREELYCGDR